MKTMICVLIIFLVAFGLIFGCTEEASSNTPTGNDAGSTIKAIDDCNNYPIEMKNQCIITIARKDNNVSLCEFLPNRTENNKYTSSQTKVDCLTQIALDNGDWTICRVIETTNSDSNIGANDKDICIKMVADSKRDATLCSNIAQTPVKEWCFNSVATLNADKSVCNLAGGLEEQCIKNINAICASCQKEGIVCPNNYKCE